MQIITLYLLWWAGWVILQVFVLHRLGLDWSLSVLDSMVFVAGLALACATSAIIFRFYQPGPAGHFYRLAFTAGIAILFSYAFFYAMQQLIPTPWYHSFLERSMPVRFGFALAALSFQAILSWLSSLLAEQQAMMRHRREVQDLAREAELAKLRQQLQPHFLFNSLNSISALAGSQPAQAREMIQQLSDFLRATLRKDEPGTIPLAEELRHLDLYLEIEKVRFGHRLKVEKAVEEGCADKPVPPMLLQPVAENAIKFGLYGNTGEVVISISIKCAKDHLSVSVRNPFSKEDSAGKGTGFGLKSLSRRLQLLYGRSDLLQVNQNEGIFETLLIIPV